MSSQLFTNITGIQMDKKVYIQAEWPIRPELVPVSVHEATRNISTPSLDGMLVYRRVTPSIKFAGTHHLYTWVERGIVRLKCLAQEHNAMSTARANIWNLSFPKFTSKL